MPWGRCGTTGITQKPCDVPAAGLALPHRPGAAPRCRPSTVMIPTIPVRSFAVAMCAVRYNAVPDGWPAAVLQRFHSGWPLCARCSLAADAPVPFGCVLEWCPGRTLVRPLPAPAAVSQGAVRACLCAAWLGLRAGPWNAGRMIQVIQEAVIMGAACLTARPLGGSARCCVLACWFWLPQHCSSPVSLSRVAAAQPHAARHIAWWVNMAGQQPLPASYTFLRVWWDGWVIRVVKWASCSRTCSFGSRHSPVPILALGDGHISVAALLRACRGSGWRRCVRASRDLLRPRPFGCVRVQWRMRWRCRSPRGVVQPVLCTAPRRRHRLAAMPVGRRLATGIVALRDAAAVAGAWTRRCCPPLVVSCFVLATVGSLDSGVGPTRPPSCPPDSGGPTVRISTSQRARAVVPYLPVPYAAAPVTGRSRAQPMVGRASQWEFAHVGLTARLALPRVRPPTNSLLPSTAGSGRAGNHFIVPVCGA